MVLSIVGQGSFLEAFAGTLPGPDLLLHCVRQHSVEKYRGWLSDADSVVWLAEVPPGGGPVGYLVLTKPDLPLADLGPEDLEVKRVYLFHRFQGRGLGAQLMDAAAAEARRRGKRRLLLGVYSKNEAAIAFYERLGYRRVGERPFQVGHNTYHDFVLALTLG
jgi:ribosomal protein S18 acetylase RimI-like enzyme